MENPYDIIQDKDQSIEEMLEKFAKDIENIINDTEAEKEIDILRRVTHEAMSYVCGLESSVLEKASGGLMSDQIDSMLQENPEGFEKLRKMDAAYTAATGNVRNPFPSFAEIIADVRENLADNSRAAFSGLTIHTSAYLLRRIAKHAYDIEHGAER